MVSRATCHRRWRGIALNPPVPGVVVRLRMADQGAWVALDVRHEDEDLHPFEADDSRGRHVLTFPEWCEPEPEPVADTEPAPARDPLDVASAELVEALDDAIGDEPAPGGDGTAATVRDERRACGGAK